ncbi:MAG: hypothetical protein IPN34_07775 [Planctomycetes bacterium]|nr:hypothetical protein [Planctomycetota bacterium]
MLRSIRMRWGGHRFTVYLRDAYRESLAEELAGMELHRDKPTGGRLRFLKRLRAERFDLAVMAWQGAPEFNRMKLVGVLCGAKERHVYNENLDSFTIEGGENPIWLQHVKWRIRARSSGPRGLPFAGLLRFYQRTLGLLFGVLATTLRFTWLRLRRAAST